MWFCQRCVWLVLIINKPILFTFGRCCCCCRLFYDCLLILLGVEHASNYISLSLCLLRTISMNVISSKMKFIKYTVKILGKHKPNEKKKNQAHNVDNDDNYSHKNYLYKRHKSARAIRITGNEFCATSIPCTDQFFCCYCCVVALSRGLIEKWEKNRQRKKK